MYKCTVELLLFIYLLVDVYYCLLLFIVVDTAEGKQVPPDQRTTTPYLTKYEKARVVGTRALQIRLVCVCTHSVHMYVSMYVCIYICLSIHMYVSIHTYIHVYIYPFIHMYIHI